MALGIHIKLTDLNFVSKRATTRVPNPGWTQCLNFPCARFLRTRQHQAGSPPGRKAACFRPPRSPRPAPALSHLLRRDGPRPPFHPLKFRPHLVELAIESRHHPFSGAFPWLSRRGAPALAPFRGSPPWTLLALGHPGGDAPQSTPRSKFFAGALELLGSLSLDPHRLSDGSTPHGCAAVLQI